MKQVNKGQSASPTVRRCKAEVSRNAQVTQRSERYVTYRETAAMVTKVIAALGLHSL